MTAARLPDWLTPPEEGRTAEDLDRIPDLPPHTELIDGSLVFVSPQTLFHMRVVNGLFYELERQAPDGLLVTREMTITLAHRQRPEPDLAVAVETETEDEERTDLPVADVLLVVEVVSQESEVRDRERKPQLYAAAGIPDYWRVEKEDGEPVVYAYELASGDTYHLAAVHRGRLKTSRPFPADIDLTSLRRRRS